MMYIYEHHCDVTGRHLQRWFVIGGNFPKVTFWGTWVMLGPWDVWIRQVWVTLLDEHTHSKGSLPYHWPNGFSLRYTPEKQPWNQDLWKINFQAPRYWLFAIFRSRFEPKNFINPWFLGGGNSIIFMFISIPGSLGKSLIQFDFHIFF